jgi:hypothetical protein
VSTGAADAAADAAAAAEGSDGVVASVDVAAAPHAASTSMQATAPTSALGRPPRAVTVITLSVDRITVRLLVRMRSQASAA